MKNIIKKPFVWISVFLLAFILVSGLKNHSHIPYDIVTIDEAKACFLPKYFIDGPEPPVKQEKIIASPKQIMDSTINILGPDFFNKSNGDTLITYCENKKQYIILFSEKDTEIVWRIKVDAVTYGILEVHGIK